MLNQTHLLSYNNTDCISMTLLHLIMLIPLYVEVVDSFWDMGTTTTPKPDDEDAAPRESMFRWQKIIFDWWSFWSPGFVDWITNERNRRLNCMAGLSIDFHLITTAMILNRRILLTSANPLEPYKDRQKDIRIWALGRSGEHNTPYRYRVWLIDRVIPRSANPEHQHGPYGVHTPRHDLAIIKSLDQMYLYATYPTRWHYPYRIMLPGKHQIIETHDLMIAGSGFKTMEHIRENYKMQYTMTNKGDIVDCSKYLPKWWGKFICIKNVENLAGVQSGGALLGGDFLYGVGCFEIRYNQDRVLVFTDVRYYIDQIHAASFIFPGMYYEYAYTQWGVATGITHDDNAVQPINPTFYIWHDLYPLGK